jgi:hypothetical protein
MLIDRRQLRARLSEAIERAAEDMPKDATRRNDIRHDPTCDIIFGCKNPEHIQLMPSSDFLALVPLVELLESLDADIATLEGKGQ